MITPRDRKTLVRLASALPKGSEERRSILAGLRKVAAWEEEVLIELADHLKIDPSELKIMDANNGKTWEGYGVRIMGPSVRGSRYGEWRVFPNERAAKKEAFGLILERAEDDAPRYYEYGWMSDKFYKQLSKQLGEDPLYHHGNHRSVTPERVTSEFLQEYGLPEGIYSGSGAQGGHVKLRSGAHAFGADDEA